MENIFVTSGTSVLGFQTITLLSKNGYSVHSISKPPLQEKLLKLSLENHCFGDFTGLSDAEVIRWLRGMDTVFYTSTLSSDTIAPKPAQEFFFRENVEPLERLMKLAKEAGVRRFILFTSFYNALSRKWPELELSEVHPFIHSTLEQEKLADELTARDFQVVVLLTPFLLLDDPDQTTSFAHHFKQIRQTSEASLFQAEPIRWTFLTEAGLSRALQTVLTDDRLGSGSYLLGSGDMEALRVYELLQAEAKFPFEIKLVTAADLEKQGMAERQRLREDASEAGLASIERAKLKQRSLVLDENQLDSRFYQDEPGLEDAVRARLAQLQ